MSTTHILGFPRIGAKRELKSALETFWRGELPQSDLLAVGRELRSRHWRWQREAGLDFVTVGDFSWYDSVLDMTAHLGCVPERFGFDPESLTLPQYFALARGDAEHAAMEMTKWFDTNYHYLVPEWSAETRFDGGVEWLFDDVTQAAAEGHRIKVALVGPLTLLSIGKIRPGLLDKLDLLPRVIAAYQRLLARLKDQGVSWVQIDEPILAQDLNRRWLRTFGPTYEALAGCSPRILLATYYGPVAEHADLLKSLPVDGLHLDLVRGREQLDAVLPAYPESKVLSLGVVDGRNIWRADLDAALDVLKPAHDQLHERLWVSASCSLLHVPVDLSEERALDPETRSWLAFARQKLEEIVCLERALTEGSEVIAPVLAASREAASSRTLSERVRSDTVRQRLLGLSEQDLHRQSPFTIRSGKQKTRLGLPVLPTTTIGSFPQTPSIRRMRAALKNGQMEPEAYREAMRGEIREVVAHQEALGLDVLVHGEAERNDMIEYFAAHLQGFAVTENGWVQSYGSRCVKPPIIYGDVERPGPITVEWTEYAQSLTSRPMKGMLTGPVTMLQWSFVRDDQSHETTALQIALALRDEVRDLEQAGVAIIQIDEPALREGLPLRERDWTPYLGWAVQAFRVASCGVADDTQVHTHMCYADFNDILLAIAALDADVITIETSRSHMELLDGFRRYRYPNEIGPGVYDVHSPRVPDVDEMVSLLEKAGRLIPWDRLWVVPDCGLKTRGWPETEAALGRMVEAAHLMRARVNADRANNADQADHEVALRQ
jgi:5-methyltetrahydropteroyltriglutamate--homocysteine methyltransferase